MRNVAAAFIAALLLAACGQSTPPEPAKIATAPAAPKPEPLKPTTDGHFSAQITAADFAGSTAALQDYVIEKRPAKVVLLTECSMSDNVAAAAPDVDFVRPCNLCPHMKRISLEGIYDALVEMKHEVTIPEDVRVRAQLAIDRMLALPKEKPRSFETGRPAAAVELV